VEKCMKHIVVRSALPEDIPGICHVNRGEAGPWAEINSCTAYVINRLRCGLYIQVAEYGGRIAAHGEWTVSDEFRGRTFYLGQLQVDPDLQRRGIGRRMIEDGIEHAHAANCKSVTLIPEQETKSQLFYEKCGFTQSKELLVATLPAQAARLYGKRLMKAPQEIVRTMPFVFGLSQTAAQLMWQIYNRRPEGDARQVDTLMGDGYCIQLGGFNKSPNAMLLAWAEEGKIETTVAQARAFAFALGYQGVHFYFFPENSHCFPQGSIKAYTYEMIRYL